MLSQFLALIVQTPPLPTRIASFPSSMEIGRGHTTRPPRFARRDGRRGHDSPQGHKITRFDAPETLWLPPALAATHRAAVLLALSLYTWICDSDNSSADVHRRISVAHCKPCINPHNSGDMPKYLPQYVLDKFTENPFSYHVTQDDLSIPLQRLSREKDRPAINRSAIEVGSSR